KSSDSFSPDSFSNKKEIRNWTKSTDFDAVVWTNLEGNFKNKYQSVHNPENVIKYLESLTGNKKALAEKYIRKAHKQIKTKIRQEVEEKLGWSIMETENND